MYVTAGKCLYLFQYLCFYFSGHRDPVETNTESSGVSILRVLCVVHFFLSCPKKQQKQSKVNKLCHKLWVQYVEEQIHHITVHCLLHCVLVMECLALSEDLDI